MVECAEWNIYRLQHSRWRHQIHTFSFVRGIHWSPVDYLLKGQWRGALMFSLICTCINGWVNNRDAGELRHHGAHYDVTEIIRYPKERRTGGIVIFGELPNEFSSVSGMASQITANSNVHFTDCWGWQQTKNFIVLHYWPFGKRNSLVTSGVSSQRARTRENVSLALRCHVRSWAWIYGNGSAIWFVKEFIFDIYQFLK